MNKKIFIGLILSCFVLFAIAQNQIQHSTVFIPFNQEVDKNTLFKKNIFIDHANKFSNGIEAVLSTTEIQKLNVLNIPHQIIIPDYTKHFQKINKLSLEKTTAQKQFQAPITFSLGSHAGYYAPFEIEFILDTLSYLYPEIASTPITIGHTYEGRKIYAIKISDNVQTDESNHEPVVYFDGMHHAREPLSMTMNMYYLFWLLENYGTDVIATHLVNNREIYFVPIVNVDGYQFNIDSNPSGGGLWRKTRKPNPGSKCIGTDPNRNYGADWGLSGSSSDPCSNIFRGDAAYSEPETKAVQSFTKLIQPITAFSFHSFGEIYLESDYDYVDKENYFADFSLDMCALENFPYGVDSEILYQTSGTTINYLDSLGTVAYIPEIGTTFWEPASDIVYYMQKHLPSCIYLTNVAGAFPDIKSVELANTSLHPGTQNHLIIELINKGISNSVSNIEVEVLNHSSNISILNNTTSLNFLNARSYDFTDGFPIAFEIDTSANVADTLFFQLAVNANGFTYEIEKHQFIIGTQNIIFSDDAESGLANFVSLSNSLYQWDTTKVMQKSGAVCFTDSKNNNSYNNTDSYLSLDNYIDLSNTDNPFIQFWIAFGMEGFNSINNPILQEFIQFEISTDGVLYQDLETENTLTSSNGEHFYEKNKKWFKETIDLNDYKVDSVKFKFRIRANGTTRPEGIYIDDIVVADYQNDTCDFSNFPTFSIEVPNCAGNAIYSIKLDNPNLANSFTYDWNTGDSLPELVNISPDNYSVQITEANGNCKTNKYFIVETIDSTLLIDDDLDGQCNFEDTCPDYNDNFDLDNNSISDYCDVCDSIKIISGTYNKFDTLKMQVNSFIESSAILLDSSFLEYTARDHYINLIVPFEVSATSEFEARIFKCIN